MQSQNLKAVREWNDSSLKYNMCICCLLGIAFFSPSLSQHFSSLGILKNRNLTFSCGEPSPQPLTLMARPAGVNFSAFRSLRQSSPIKEVRCCRHSAWPCDAAMCKRLFPLSSWILSRLSAARCGCTNRKMGKTQVNKSKWHTLGVLLWVLRRRENLPGTLVTVTGAR